MRSTVKLRTHDSTGYTTGCNGLYRLNTVLRARGILNSPIPLQSSIRLSDSDRLSKDWCISAFISPKPPIFQQELGTFWEFFLSSPNLSSLLKFYSPHCRTHELGTHWELVLIAPLICLTFLNLVFPLSEHADENLDSSDGPCPSIRLSVSRTSLRSSKWREFLNYSWCRAVPLWQPSFLLTHLIWQFVWFFVW